MKAKVEKLQSKLISGTEIDSMKERKNFFNGIKAHQDSAESVLEVIFQYLYPNSSEDLVTLLIQILLDCQKLILNSIWNGSSSLQGELKHYKIRCDFQIKQWQNVYIKFLFVQLSYVFAHLTYQQAEMEPGLSQDHLANIYMNLKEDKSLHSSSKVQSIEDLETFWLFNKNSDQHLFVNSREVVQCQTSDMKILRRKYIYYIALQGLLKNVLKTVLEIVSSHASISTLTP